MSFTDPGARGVSAGLSAGVARLIEHSTLQELHPRQLLVVPDRAVPVPDSLASGAVVDLGQWRATGFQQASSALAQYAAGGCVYRRFAVVVKAVDGMASCACSLSIPRCFHRLGFSVRDVPASAAVACGVGLRQHESGWAKLPVELLRKMLQALQAAEQWAPQGQRLVGARPRRRRGWCAVDGSAATMRW